MGHSLRVVGLLLGLVAVACSGRDPEPAELSSADRGTQVGLAMNQQVNLTLQTIGPGHYGEPSLSSSAIQFEGSTLSSSQNPGGPTQIYQFRAVGSGSALLVIPHDSGREPFTLTLGCCAQ